jgi:hypothetical protein
LQVSRFVFGIVVVPIVTAATPIPIIGVNRRGVPGTFRFARVPGDMPGHSADDGTAIWMIDTGTAAAKQIIIV